MSGSIFSKNLQTLQIGWGADKKVRKEGSCTSSIDTLCVLPVLGYIGSYIYEYMHSLPFTLYGTNHM